MVLGQKTTMRLWSSSCYIREYNNDTIYHEKRIQIFGKKGNDAVLKELKQLHDKETFNPVDPETIGPEDRRGHYHV
jgi:hypothetical protein